MRSAASVILLSYLLLSPQPARALSWQVPSPACPTVQAGLDSAATGDTVLVAAGTYEVEMLFWPPHVGVLLLGAGLDSTIIRGDGSQAVLLVTSKERAELYVEQFATFRLTVTCEPDE